MDKDEVARKNKLFVVVSGLDVSQTAERYSRRLEEIEFQKDINEFTTHVVMHTVPKKGHVSDRTLKYFIGISKGLWIVNECWLVDSSKAKRILSEDDYEIFGDCCGDKHEGPRKARNSSCPLFKDYTFILKNFKSQGDMTQNNVKTLIENLGGTVRNNKEEIREKNMFVVGLFDGDNDLEQTIKEPADIPWVSVHWLLDSLSCYNVLDMDSYLLNSGKLGDKSNKMKERTKCSRSQGSKSWSKIEQEAVLRHLGQHVLTEKLPGKHQCEEVKRKEVALSQRSWQQIKFFIRNRITSKNRQKNPLLVPFQS